MSCESQLLVELVSLLLDRHLPTYPNLPSFCLKIPEKRMPSWQPYSTDTVTVYRFLCSDCLNRQPQAGIRWLAVYDRATRLLTTIRRIVIVFINSGLRAAEISSGQLSNNYRSRIYGLTLNPETLRDVSTLGAFHQHPKWCVNPWTRTAPSWTADGGVVGEMAGAVNYNGTL